MIGQTREGPGKDRGNEERKKHDEIYKRNFLMCLKYKMKFMF